MNKTENNKKIAFLVSHPVQYHAPLFKLMDKEGEIDTMVYYCWDFGVRPTDDPEFGVKVKWDIPVLDGYKYTFLKNWAFKPSSARPWGEINPGIISAIFKGDYDAVVVFGWGFVSSWLAFMTCILSRTPFFIKGESPLSQELLKSPWKLKLKRAILGWLFRRATALLYIGEENKQFYKYYGVPEEKLFFAPQAIDNDRFIKAAEELKDKKIELRKKHGIPEDSIVIMTAGKLIQKKRPMDLLRAFRLLNSNFSNLDSALVFLGDGHLRPNVEKYAREHNLRNVFITGFKNQLELPEYYAMADIFVLPSGPGETWGLVVNEAMCFGLPVIASDVVGCGPDLVRDGENGYIFELGDEASLSKCLYKLAESRELRKEAGNISRRLVEYYSFNTIIDGIKSALFATKKHKKRHS